MCDICNTKTEDYLSVFTIGEEDTDHDEGTYDVIKICKKCYSVIKDICEGKFKKKISQHTKDNSVISCSICNKRKHLKNLFLIRKIEDEDKEITFCEECNEKYFSSITTMGMILKEDEW